MPPRKPPPVAPPDLLAAVRALIARDGLDVVARRLGVSRHALGNFASGGFVRNGTIALVERALRFEADAPLGVVTGG